MKWIVIIVFISLFSLITFFGLGPVLFADGSVEERLLTLLIVLLIYVALIISVKIFLKKFK